LCRFVLRVGGPFFREVLKSARTRGAVVVSVWRVLAGLAAHSEGFMGAWGNG